VKKSSGNETGQEIVIPSGRLALAAQGVLSRCIAEQILRHVLDGGEIGRSVFGPNPALVIAEDHVDDPMQAVFNGPMAARPVRGDAPT
jgi:hypothetical protein